MGCLSFSGPAGPTIFGPGESWYEAPGCHHVRSENVGEPDEEAQFVANLVIDTSTFEAAADPVSAVVVIDAETEERSKM